MQSQGNRFERQPPAPPQTYDASFVRAGGAPVAFAVAFLVAFSALQPAARTRRNVRALIAVVRAAFQNCS